MSSLKEKLKARARIKHIVSPLIMTIPAITPDPRRKSPILEAFHHWLASQPPLHTCWSTFKKNNHTVTKQSLYTMTIHVRVNFNWMLKKISDHIAFVPLPSIIGLENMPPSANQMQNYNKWPLCILNYFRKGASLFSLWVLSSFLWYFSLFWLAVKITSVLVFILVLQHSVEKHLL